jgi:hypothetical protein
MPRFLWVGLMLLACGCARSPQAPLAKGRACKSSDDCNRSADGSLARCGPLRLCVSGRCEVSPDGGTVGSRLVVCAGDGGAR